MIFAVFDGKVVVALELEEEACRCVAGDVDDLAFGACVFGWDEEGLVGWSGAVGVDG